MKAKLTLMLGLLLSSSLTHAGTVLASCEGQDKDQTRYLFEIQRSYGRKLNGYVYRYDSKFRQDKLVLINGPVPLHDDIFDDQGIIHHLIDEDVSHEDPEGAQIHISYRSMGATLADAYIRFRSWSDLPNHPDDFLVLTDAVCNFPASSLINR